MVKDQEDHWLGKSSRENRVNVWESSHTAYTAVDQRGHRNTEDTSTTARTKDIRFSRKGKIEKFTY